jgi:signal transduction histidine kinase
VLGFVDAEKQHGATERRDVAVADSFDAVEPLFSADIERKHLTVERALGDARIAVLADPKGLQQILASLLSNACKYSRDGGTITLGAVAEGKKVRIWVRDSGIGLGKEELDRVFDAFFQADSSTTRHYSGVGLGLTIARDLARRMDGEVTLASEAGKGTIATVIVPAGRIATGSDAEASAEPSAELVSATVNAQSA